MITYLLLSKDKEEAENSIVNAGLATFVNYTETSVVLVPIAGLVIIQTGPQTVGTGVFDEDGGEIFENVPDTWQSLIITETALTDEQIDGLKPTTVHSVTE